MTGSWPGGFQARGDGPEHRHPAITGWTVGWTFANGQTDHPALGRYHTQTGATVTVQNAEYNGNLAPGATTTFGFLGRWTGTNAVPSPVTCTRS